MNVIKTTWSCDVSRCVHSLLVDKVWHMWSNHEIWYVDNIVCAQTIWYRFGKIRSNSRILIPKKPIPNISACYVKSCRQVQDITMRWFEEKNVKLSLLLEGCGQTIVFEVGRACSRLRVANVCSTTKISCDSWYFRVAALIYVFGPAILLNLEPIHGGSARRSSTGSEKPRSRSFVCACFSHVVITAERCLHNGWWQGGLLSF